MQLVCKHMLACSDSPLVLGNELCDFTVLLLNARAFLKDLPF